MDEELGNSFIQERPGWLPGVILSALGAVVGTLMTSILLFSEAEETLTVSVTVGQNALPKVIRAPGTGVVQRVLASDGDHVQTGQSVLELASSSSEHGEVASLGSPADGQFVYARTISEGTHVSRDDVLGSIVEEIAFLEAYGYADVAGFRKLRPKQPAKLLFERDGTRLVVRGSVDSVSAVPLEGPHLVRFRLEPDTNLVEEIQRRGTIEADAAVIIRKRGLQERIVDLVERMTEAVR